MTFQPDPDSPKPTPTWRDRLNFRLPRWRPAGPRVSVPAGPLRRWTWRLLLILVLPFVYYGGGALWVHVVDDNPDFAPVTTNPGESRAAAMAIALVDREINRHRWTPSEPFFMPAAILDNMPNYQIGIMAAVGRFTVELRDQMGRQRGSSQVDGDLAKAAGDFAFPPDRWLWEPSVSLWPSATSTAQYRSGLRSLQSWSRRVGEGQAIYERRADAIIALLDRIAADIGSDSAVIDQQIVSKGGNLFDFHADNMFYANKGRLYAYYLILREIGVDYQAVLRERNSENAWRQMVDSFRTAATLQPWIIVNGAPDSQFLPSHLAAQGFYLLRTRTQLRELADILRK